MPKQHGPWTILRTKRKFRNALMEVREDEVIQPDGEQGTCATVQMAPGVAILPVDEEGFVYLTRQFRYAIGRESVEVASGTVEADEEPLEAAQREAREELGIEAEEWVELGVMDPLPALVAAPVHLFAARDIILTQPKREGAERLISVKMSLNEAVALVMQGTISDGASGLLLLKAFALL